MRHFKKIGILTSVALTTLLTACASTPYATPKVPLTAQFAHAGEDNNAAAPSADWWTAFNDPALNALISDVLTRNNDLAAAALKVQQAQLQAGLTKLDQFPSASGSLGVSSSDNTSYSSSLSVSYEADLYGKLVAATRSANWEAVATEEDRQASRLSLIGTACELYWRIAYTHQQITSGQQDLDYALKVQNLVNIQHDAGSASGVEVAEADQTVNSQRASLADLQQQLVEYRASLTVLLGGTPLAEASEPQALPDIALPDVRAGLPSELLSRRPDLRAAELRLRENLSDVDIAKKALYPGLSLTASGGSASSELSNLFKDPTGSLAASLSLPFLDFPRLSRDVKISRKTYEIAVLDFKTTLLNALADTDNALSNRTQLAAQTEAQKASLDAARKAEDLYAIRYRTGSVALRTWLDAQSSRRSAQLTYDNIRLSQLINQSTLYQALGGGTDTER